TCWLFLIFCRLCLGIFRFFRFWIALMLAIELHLQRIISFSRWVLFTKLFFKRLFNIIWCLIFWVAKNIMSYMMSWNKVARIIFIYLVCFLKLSNGILQITYLAKNFFTVIRRLFCFFLQ